MSIPQAIAAGTAGDKLSRVITGTDEVSAGRSAIATGQGQLWAPRVWAHCRWVRALWAPRPSLPLLHLSSSRPPSSPGASACFAACSSEAASHA